MKRVLIISAYMLLASTVFAQNYDKAYRDYIAINVVYVGILTGQFQLGLVQARETTIAMTNTWLGNGLIPATSREVFKQMSTKDRENTYDWIDNSVALQQLLLLFGIQLSGPQILQSINIDVPNLRLALQKRGS